MKGIGGLVKKENVVIEPLIHGGKSTTKDRSGTPATALIVSMAKALRLAYENLEEKQKYVKELNIFLRNELEKNEITINSPEVAIPNILNISLENIKPETVLHALEEKEIYISTKTACATNDSSDAVYAITKDEEKAKHSLRISLSYLTTKKELEIFITELVRIRSELSSLYAKKD
jgi:cysteine desulfurase